MHLDLGHFHDDELVNVTYDRKEAELKLEFAHDEFVSSISFAKIYQYRISGHVKQNVVSCLRASDADTGGRNAMERKHIQHYVEWIFAESFPLKVEGREEIVERVLNHELVLLVMEPAVGAEFAVLSRSYRLACTCNRHVDR